MEQIKAEILCKVMLELALAFMIPLQLCFLQQIIDLLIEDFEVGRIVKSLSILVCLFLVKVFLQRLNQLTDIKWDKKIVEKVEPMILDKKSKIKFECYEDEKLHDVLELMGNNISGIIREGFQTLMDVLSGVITLIGIAIVYSQISLKITVAFVLLISVSLLMELFYLLKFQ